MVKEVKLKAKVTEVDETAVDFEFGATQAEMIISSNGTHQRKLRLKKDDKVEVIIRKK